MPPDTFFWIKKVPRDGHIEKLVSSDALMKKVKKMREVLERNPDNEKVKQMIDETLVEYEISKELEDNRPKPTVEDTVDYLALNAKELKMLTDAFKDMDIDDSGDVSTDVVTSYFIKYWHLLQSHIWQESHI